MDVLRHVLLVTTDVEISAVFKPFPNFCTVFDQAMLNIDFLGLVTGPCCGEPVQTATVHPFFDGFLVIEFGLCRLVAKEKPISAFAAIENTLLHECPERCDASARPDHDDVRTLVFWQNERFGWRHEHTDWGTCRIDFISHELGG